MAALAEEQTEELDREDVCASIDPCFAFKVPPAAREGHKAAVWKEAGHVWTGKLGEHQGSWRAREEERSDGRVRVRIPYP